MTEMRLALRVFGVAARVLDRVGETHIARHHVVPHEVAEILYGRPRYLVPGRSGTRLVLGTTAAGRHLLLVINDAPDGELNMVTARPVTDPERRTFRREGS